MSSLILAPWRVLKRNDAQIQEAREAFMTRPVGAFFVAILYGATYGAMFFAVQDRSWLLKIYGVGGLFPPLAMLVVRWVQAFLVNLVALPIYGWIARFALHRVIGDRRPKEPNALGVPTGVWLALAGVGCVMLLFLAAAICVELQPWWPGLAAWVRGNWIKTFAPVSMVIMAFYVARIYGIQNRSAEQWRLASYIVTPQILLALAGMVIAIAMGVHQRHEREAAQASAKMAMPTTLPASPGPVIALQQNSKISMVNLVQQSHETVCYGNGPMRMPRVPTRYAGTVLGMVHENVALTAIRRGETYVNGRLDAQYLYSHRVAIHPDAAPYGENVMAVIPLGMALDAGTHVIYATGYADPHRPCHYLPNEVVKRLGD